MLRTVKRCLLCGDTAIDATVAGRFVTTSCRACHAVLQIEFDPPDQPHLRALIERIDAVEDGEQSPAGTARVEEEMRSLRVRPR
jgi:hypothetical protein